MTDTATALFALHAVFLFATCLGFTLPLAIAGAEQRAERMERRKNLPPSPADLLAPLLDLWLLLEDAIPVFWLLARLRNTPDDVKAARQKWREESSIRWMFWISAVTAAALPLHFLFSPFPL